MTDIEKEPTADFKIALECSLLRGIVSSASTFVNEINLKVNKKGISMVFVDPAHVAMGEIYVSKDCFEDYWCKKEGVFGIDLDKLKGCLKGIKDREVVQLQSGTKKGIVQGEQTDVPALVFQYGDYTRKMSMVNTLGMSDPKIPNLNLNCAYEMTWVDIQEILYKFQDISDHIKITASKKGVEFSAESDTVEASVKKPKDLLISLEVTGTSVEDEHFTSLYPLDYLTNPFKKSANIGFKPFFKNERWLNVIKIRTSENYPIRLESERNGLELLFLLAPRIESE